MKLASCKGALIPPTHPPPPPHPRWFALLTVLRRWSRCWSYSLLLCGLFYEAICCMSYLVSFCSCVFSVLLVLRLPRLEKRELIFVLFVRLFDLCLFGFVGFLFLLGLVRAAVCDCSTPWTFLLPFLFSTFRMFDRFVLVWICRFLLPLDVWERLRFVIVALPGFFSYFFYSTDRSMAVVPVLVLLFLALRFILRGDLFYVLPCVILFLFFVVVFFFSPFGIAIT